MEDLILKSTLCPGDMVVMTAAIRDLMAAHPGKYRVDVRTNHPDVFANNPHITPLTSGREIAMHYPLINQSNQLPYHFIHGYRMHLEKELGVSIPAGVFRPDLHLSEHERNYRPKGTPRHYWLFISGGKTDFTCKWWNPIEMQAVIEELPLLDFIQVGHANDVHFLHEAPNCTSWVGKTTLRQLIHLVAHADGVICPVTALMHISASLPMSDGRIRPCIVIAGGREPAHWEQYPGHTYLNTIGKLSCCASGGCWKSRVQPGIGGDHDKSLCVEPVSLGATFTANRGGVPMDKIPKCMDMIWADDVIDSMSGRASSFPPPEPKPELPDNLPEPKKAPCCGQVRNADDPAVWGPRMWRELHLWSVSGKCGDKLEQMAWVQAWTDRVPCPECRDFVNGLEWGKILKGNEPREFGFWLHNEVNIKLGKPHLGYSVACKHIESLKSAPPKDHIKRHARLSVCATCEAHQKATETTPAFCTSHQAPILEYVKSGECSHWPDYAEPETTPTLTDTERDAEAGDFNALADEAGVGVVIGTYAAVPYIHFQLEQLRRLYGYRVRVLVVDDASSKSEELAAICRRYGAMLKVNAVRYGHAAGDMQVFWEGLTWAKANGLRYLVKFSRRWIPLVDWIPDMLSIFACTSAPTLSAICRCHGFGFRSECVAMDVDKWADTSEAWKTLSETIARAPRGVDVGQSGILVEHVIHVCAAAVKQSAGWQSEGNFAVWPLMAENRCAAIPGVLWHEANRATEYDYHARTLGIEYPAEAWIDREGNINR